MSTEATTAIALARQKEAETAATAVLAQQKDAYLTFMKKRLSLVAREFYDRSIGGPEALEEYRTQCHQLKKVKTMGELLRVAHDMELDVATVVRLVLQPYLGVERKDFVNAPEKWD